MWFELCVALGCEVLSEFAVRKSAFAEQNTRFGSGYFHPLVPTPASSSVPGQGCLFTAPQGSAFPITLSADPFHCSLCVIRGHAAQTRNKGNRYKIRHRENATK